MTPGLLGGAVARDPVFDGQLIPIRDKKGKIKSWTWSDAGVRVRVGPVAAALLGAAGLAALAKLFGIELPSVPGLPGAAPKDKKRPPFHPTIRLEDLITSREGTVVPDKGGKLMIVGRDTEEFSQMVVENTTEVDLVLHKFARGPKSGFDPAIVTKSNVDETFEIGRVRTYTQDGRGSVEVSVRKAP